jgi:LPXTG-motif cell wall-anchored protein
MKILGIIVGITGAVLFVWHLVKVMLDTEIGTGIFTHHILSLVGGVIMIVGIGIYILGRRRNRG